MPQLPTNLNGSRVAVLFCLDVLTKYNAQTQSRPTQWEHSKFKSKLLLRFNPVVRVHYLVISVLEVTIPGHPSSVVPPDPSTFNRFLQ